MITYLGFGLGCNEIAYTTRRHAKNISTNKILL